ncbi:hypothetical protein [Methylosinus sporium]|uniref:hypothetical protein n=1 Tax=Methylosinus sporium TaxID=428 RepID=UPI00383B9DE1
MEPKLVLDPLDVESHLFAMGLDKAGLITAVRYAESERALCTSFDPVGFGNMVAYARCGRKLRENYIRRGKDWELDNSHNQVAIKNPKTKIRVIPCNFDEGAGDKFVIPSNKSPKGEVSRQKSMCNRTSWIPGLIEKGLPVDVDGYRTWVLGMNIVDDRPPRAELSMPIDFDGQYFSNFATRIFFLDGKDLPAIATKKTDDTFEVIDIKIRRK